MFYQVLPFQNSESRLVDLQILITRAQPYQIDCNLDQNYQHDDAQVTRGVSGILLNTHNSRVCFPDTRFLEIAALKIKGSPFSEGSAYIYLYIDVM